MNNLLRNVLMRRSVHKFDARQIRDEELREILEEGKLLSNAANNQAWHFTVIQNSSLLKRINDANLHFLSEAHGGILKEGVEDSGFLSQVPMMLVISGKEDMKYAEDAANTVFGSMMLVAEKYGIGACWISSIPKLFATKDGQEINAIINIPEGYTPLCVGAFGYKESVVVPEIQTMDDHIVHVIK